MYYHHSGYVGGLKANNFEKVIARHPTQPLENAIKGMLPKGPLGRKLAKNAKVYAGATHPHTAQNPTAIDL
jgi:large subunit ribosomal protein L13